MACAPQLAPQLECMHSTCCVLSTIGLQVDAQLTAAEIPHELFDAIVSADVFERLKPAPGKQQLMGY